MCIFCENSGLLVLGAWQPCMLTNTNLEGPLEPMYVGCMLDLSNYYTYYYNYMPSPPLVTGNIINYVQFNYKILLYHGFSFLKIHGCTQSLQCLC